MRSFITPLLAFAITAVACRGLASLAQRVPQLRLLDLPDARKQHAAAVPVVGGLGILAGLLLAALLSGQAWPAEVLLPALSLFLVGLVDDLRGMRAVVKLLAQILCAWWLVRLTGASLYAVPLPFAYGHWVLGPLATPVTVVLVVAVLNAVNMIDGLDGLAGGCLAIAALGIAYAAQVTGHGELAALALVLFAALAGFLLWNARFPWQQRARLFLGDAGALGVGLILCWLMFRVSLTQGATRVPVTVALAPLAVPMIDMAVVAFWRVAEGHNPMRADRGHSHHLLLALGLSAEGAVRLIWVASALVTVLTCAAWQAGVAEGRLLGVLVLAALLHMVWFRRSWLALRRRLQGKKEGQ